jgi:hypothetical protein
LSASDAEEGVHFGRRRRRSIMRRSARTWHNRWSLGLILTPRRTARALLGRIRWRGCHSWACGFVLTATQMATTLFFHRSTEVQTRSTCISHEGKCGEEKP